LSLSVSDRPVHMLRENWLDWVGLLIRRQAGCDMRYLYRTSSWSFAKVKELLQITHDLQGQTSTKYDIKRRKCFLSILQSHQ